jgi:hypothetical protein
MGGPANADPPTKVRLRTHVLVQPHRRAKHTGPVALRSDLCERATGTATLTNTQPRCLRQPLQILTSPAVFIARCDIEGDW